jgi:hypothetical protein
MGDCGECAIDGRMALLLQSAMVVVMGGRWWVMAGVTMGDTDGGGTILMAVNGGGAMDGRTAATAHWLLPWMVAEANRAVATVTRVAGEQWRRR